MEDEPKKKPDKKICIIGDMGVGKTALVRRYIEGIYHQHVPSTIGVCNYEKEWNDSVIAIWDTAGQQNFTNLATYYLKNAHGVMLCYSMDDLSSFESVESRHINLLSGNVADDCVVVLVGTKSDLVKDDSSAVVSHEKCVYTAEQFNKDWNSPSHPRGITPYFETSSKDELNVKEVFEYFFEILAPKGKTKRKSSWLSLKSTSSIDREKPSDQSTEKSSAGCCEFM